MTKEEFLKTIKGEMIISCQAVKGEPLYVEEKSIMYLMARAAKQAGAKCIRTSSVRDVIAIKEETGLPVIGLIKKQYEGFDSYITTTMKEVDELVEAKSDVIAIDCCFSKRGDGKDISTFMKEVRAKYPDQILMADISTFEEAKNAQEIGFDLVSTTMSGYSKHTANKDKNKPDFELLEKCVKELSIPTVCEGKIHSPEDAVEAFKRGAYAIVVGGAITRPLEIAQRFYAALKNDKYILFDIGGTNIKMATYDGCLSEVKEYPTDAKLGADKLVLKIIDLLDKESDFKAIGISTAGQVNVEEGYIIYANENMPGYTGTRWKDILESKYNVPVFVENDVNAAALGEGYAGVAKDKKDYLCLTYGTGVGGAIVINGDVYHGSSGSAGEFGAMLLDINLHSKGDAFSGGYEKIGSTSSLVKRAMEYKKELNSGRIIFNNLDDNNVLEIVKSWTYDVSLGLTSLIHIFNPSMVVLGGGIMEQDLVFKEVLKNVEDEIMPSFKGVKIEKAKLGNKAGLYGVLSMIEKNI